MFNIDKSIAEWRKQMLAAGIQTPVPLDELEIHLREENERLKKSGVDERTAFENAVHQTGQPQALKGEFNKIETPFMKTVLTCVPVLLIGIAAQLPGSLQLRDQLVISDKWLGLWLLGLIFQMWSLESLRQIIQPKLTGRALKKVEWSFPKANLKTGAGVSVLLVGVALMAPAATQFVCNGSVTFDTLCRLVFGICLLIPGALVTFCPYQRKMA
jgi:hypothetical protein